MPTAPNLFSGSADYLEESRTQDSIRLQVTPRKAVMAENLSNQIQRSGVWDGPAVGPVTEHATIGSSIVIKGEVSGTEALFIDGTVEGRSIFRTTG